jgi:hypothetical protein
VLVPLSVYPDSLAPPRLIPVGNQYYAKVTLVVKATAKKNLGNGFTDHSNLNYLHPVKAESLRKPDFSVAVGTSLSASVRVWAGTVVDFDAVSRRDETLRQSQVFVEERLSQHV